MFVAGSLFGKGMYVHMWWLIGDLLKSSLGMLVAAHWRFLWGHTGDDCSGLLGIYMWWIIGDVCGECECKYSLLYILFMQYAVVSRNKPPMYTLKHYLCGKESW